MGLKLEVGKTYRTRSGDLVLIKEQYRDGWFAGECAGGYRSWDENGSWSVDSNEHRYDLVEEVPPVIEANKSSTTDGDKSVLIAVARRNSCALSCIMAAVDAAHG